MRNRHTERHLDSAVDFELIFDILFFFFIIRCAISGKCLLFGSFGDAFFLNERQPTKKSQRLNEWTKKGKPHILYSSLGFRQLQQLLLLH